MVEINYEDIENLAEEKLIEKVVSTVLEMEQIKKKLDVYITLTNNENIRKINAEHRQIDKATDVLSFPMFDRTEIDSLKVEDDMEDILGDIIVSVEKVREQAEEYGHSVEREVAFLSVHGYLHLCGFDHMTPEDEEVMFKKQDDILHAANIERK